MNNFGEVMSNSRNTVARPIQPILSLNIGIRGPPGRSLEPRHILLWHTTVGWYRVKCPEAVNGKASDPTALSTRWAQLPRLRDGCAIMHDASEVIITDETCVGSFFDLCSSAS